jgi:hypothetical protein
MCYCKCWALPVPGPDMTGRRRQPIAGWQHTLWAKCPCCPWICTMEYFHVLIELAPGFGTGG